MLLELMVKNEVKLKDAAIWEQIARHVLQERSREFITDELGWDMPNMTAIREWIAETKAGEKMDLAIRLLKLYRREATDAQPESQENQAAKEKSETGEAKEPNDLLEREIQERKKTEKKLEKIK